MSRVTHMAILGGRANEVLTRSVAGAMDMDPVQCTVENFPDDELRIEIHENLRGRNVYIFQPFGPPVAERILECLLLADASRRAGAAKVVGVVPYLGYARQDRRAYGREPVSVRLVADLLSNRFDRIVSIDVHNAAMEGFFSVPLEHLSAVPLLVKKLQPVVMDDSIIVAPDLGAVKLAERYAHALDLPVAYIHKIRTSGEDVSVRRIIGDVQDRFPIIIDDMISTGGTIASAFQALSERGCRQEMIIAASHGLFAGNAVKRLAELPVRKIFVTDSIYHATSDIPLPLEVVGLDIILAEVIQRLDDAGSLSEYLFHQ